LLAELQALCGLPERATGHRPDADPPATNPPTPQAAGLVPALSDKNLVATVFAPTDKAFGKLLAELKIDAATLLKNTDLLTTVLKYHVVPGVATKAADLSDFETLTTLAGQDVQVREMQTGAAPARRSPAAAARRTPRRRRLLRDRRPLVRPLAAGPQAAVLQLWLPRRRPRRRYRPGIRRGGQGEPPPCPSSSHERSTPRQPTSGPPCPAC
jgi:hypothetical protein